MHKVTIYGHTFPHRDLLGKELKLLWNQKSRVWFGQLNDEQLSRLQPVLDQFINLGYSIDGNKRKPVSMKQAAA